MDIDLSNKLKQSLGLGLEDNADVEVNFHIDTDENGAPDADGATTETPPDASESTDALEVAGEDERGSDIQEATDDVNNASDEAEQLEEAQDSLESLTSIVNEHIENGTMSRMGLQTYRLALESLVPASVLDDVGVSSMESNIATSKYHAAVLAQTELSEVNDKLASVSMESKLDFLKKAAHAVDVFVRHEAALEKRARALLALAEDSENEHASSDTLTINGKGKSPKLPHITTLNWKTGREFISHVEHFSDLFNSMSSLKQGYDNDFTDRIFPTSKQWPKGDDGNPTYSTFRIRLVRNKNLVRGYNLAKSKATVQLPNLKPSECKIVLNNIIDSLNRGKVMKANLKEMNRILKTVVKREYKTKLTNTSQGGLGVGLDITETYPDGYLEMYQTLLDMRGLRIKVNSDIMKYVNHCLNDRDFV